MKKPGILLGALVGGLLTIPLLAIFYLGQQMAGFPFVPFTLFATIRDNTPGGLITKTIDSMISVITTLNLGRLDNAAKSMEQAMGIMLVVVIGAVAVAIFFAIMRRQETRQDWLPGTILGLIVGVLMTLPLFIGTQVYSADKLTSVIWLIGLFLLWGYLANWAYNRLTYPPLGARAPKTEEVSVVQVDRRQFLVTLGGAAAAITVVGAFVANLSGQQDTTVSTGAVAADIPQAAMTDLPNAAAKIEPAPGTRPELTSVPDFYRIDIAPIPPQIDEASWTLPITTTAADGSTTSLIELTLADIRKMKSMDQYITQGCISNPIAGDLISTVKWTGVSAQDLLASFTMPEGATHLYITGADGFFETVPLDTIAKDPTVMFAYAFNDEPLPARNGFPLRIHVPDHYGMKQPKWITGIQVMTHDVDGFWVVRGWDKQAFIRTTSVIDTVATSAVITDNGQKLVPVGGIAWGGARSISKVEVSVDSGDWVEAQLREPLSHKTWVIWRYDWPFAAGAHTFAVRAYDGNGDLQITDDNPPHPAGATGIHEVSVSA